jgi:hypothetical protein
MGETALRILLLADGAQRCAADDVNCYRWDPSVHDVATGTSRGKAIISTAAN